MNCWRTCASLSGSNREDAERPERHAHAERWHDNQPQTKRARYRYLALPVFAACCQSIALAILACSSAWYEERTSGPDATFLKPIL
ncbi:hypothetical protein B1F73_06350 [Pseudomonas syringae]|nr:hypothetical protein B1F77_19885 [Pseudomonas syringae]RXT84410.1 hypothetical protein B1F72_15665 [Pseudomonas syringae]RXU01364.1 hypothetical protein B1F73_06350 [Pseudomonas syringae]RXU21658.1 hypothetical protein B0A92_21380 [Pseudomonas syringae]